MTTPNTSTQRVDALMRHSDAIYDDIDALLNGEPRHRLMLRVAINRLATALRNSETIEQAGLRLITSDPLSPIRKAPLDALANKYADVRRGTFDRNNEPEADSRHAIHLLRLSVPYAQQHYPHLSAGVIAAYALIHDIIEAYAGDTPSLGMSATQEKTKIAIEAEALLTLQQDYGAQWPEFVQLAIAYEELADEEAKFVKTFDKLDPGFTHFSNKGLALQRFNRETFHEAIEQTTQRMARYSTSFPQLMEDRLELTRRVANAAF